MDQNTTYECPLCGTRFHDPRGASLLGRKIRCGKCGQTFILKQLANGTRPPVATASAVTPVGSLRQAHGPQAASAVADLQDEPAVATAQVPAAGRLYLKYGLAGVLLLALLAGGSYLAAMRLRPTATALGTVQAYLKVPAWRDRLAYVLEPETIRPLMESYYSGSPWKVPKFEMLTKQEPEPGQTGWVTVEADVNGNIVQYYLKKVENGYRIDWKMSVGFNEMSIEEFQATRPATPTRLRALAQLGDSFLDDYADLRDSAWSIYLMDDSGVRFIATGYAMKNTPAGDQMFAALKDGKKHRVVVEVQCRPGSNSGDRCMISKVLRIGSWLLENDQLAQGANPAKPAVNATRLYAGPKAPAGNTNVPPTMSLADAVGTASSNDPEGMLQLGKAYMDGRGVPKNEALAAEWFRRAAETGHPKAMCVLGLAYAGGIGVAKDDRQALAWYRKSAEAGNSEGMWRLGIVYAEGLGTAKDAVQAVAWLQRAAEAGNSEGMWRLGVIYFQAGTDQGDETAAMWFRRAAEAGNPEGMVRLGVMCLKGSTDQQDAEAVVWYRKAAEAGNVLAMRLLANVYEKGLLGQPQDLDEARKWYRKAADEGDEAARKALQLLR